MANGGEALRRNRTQEVAGSSPASSITKSPQSEPEDVERLAMALSPPPDQ
jgi:hypothetical protein